MLEYSRIGTGLDLVMHQIKKKYPGLASTRFIVY